MAHHIDPDQVTAWRRAGYQWHEIADQLQCTIGTLTWFRRTHNFVDPIVAIDESAEGEHFLRQLLIE